ncbi:MAG: ATP-binding cassette domain-containing protein [Pseudomonadota bacterium]
MTPLVKTENLGIHFGGLKALNNVNFTLAPGELRCLIGPNGAGKTTFFRLLTGVHRPSVGTVQIAGASVVGSQTHEIAELGVGIKTQIPSLFENLSVRENIWLSARKRNTRRAADEITEEVLVRTELESVASTNVIKLAHGQWQTVELAVVMAGRPKLVLLDEPAAGMTGYEREKTARLIEEMNKDHAIIVVEHDMEFIKMIAKTITVFNRGEVLMEDTADSVLNNERVKEVYLGKQAGGVTL